MIVIQEKTVFIAFTVLSIISVLVLICMGLYEMKIDQEELERKHKEKHSFHVTHIFISLLIFISSNIIILVHTAYITQFVLKGRRYNWHLSWNYFHYILCEIISVCCIIGKYEYLEYPLMLHVMTGVLAVFLFFFNYWAMSIFEQLEEQERDKQEERLSLAGPSTAGEGGSCIRINLKSSSPGTSVSSS